MARLSASLFRKLGWEEEMDAAPADSNADPRVGLLAAALIDVSDRKPETLEETRTIILILFGPIHSDGGGGAHIDHTASLSEPTAFLRNRAIKLSEARFAGISFYG